MIRALQSQSLEWLKEHVFPLWLDKGVDRQMGGFFESLNLSTGDPEPGPRRAMVQARQIYSLRVALEMRLNSPDRLRPALVDGARHLLKFYQLPSGAFLHSINSQGLPHNTVPELYTQAFALFGLAHAFSIEPEPEFKTAALKLVEYLLRERRVTAGGFSEFQNGAVVYQSNPHMHLFEAALSWLEADADPSWRRLADESLELCLTKFIEPTTGLLAEHFDSQWRIQRDGQRFFFEPGHQYEWSWLMGRYQNVTGRNLLSTRLRLFENAERAERQPDLHNVFDQVWNDFSIKARSSRFWPQCERIKCAAQLAIEHPMETRFKNSATEGLTALLRYFDLPKKGLWYDIFEESGQFKAQPAKASSLYHIVGAIAEYQSLKP